MKLLIFALLALPILATAQSQTPVKWEYLQTEYMNNGINSKVELVFDDGTKLQKPFKQRQTIKDSTGVIVFKSPVEALNYLGDLGWEMIEQTTFTRQGFTSVLWWFKRVRD